MKAMRVILLATVVGAVGACSDSTSPLAGRGQNVTLSIAGRVPGTSGALSAQAAGDSMVLVTGTDTLVINSVDLVLRKIELKRQQTVAGCDSSSSTDDCEELELGAILVHVPLAAGAVTSFGVAVDSGTYDKAEFTVHKPGSDSVDQAFMAANPGWPANTSIRVTGRFNGAAFTYTSPLDVDQETTFVPPLVVDASGSTLNLTLRVDVARWFRTGAGLLLDPASANAGGANESQVQDNIKNSFKTFEDQNRDGNEANG